MKTLRSILVLALLLLMAALAAATEIEGVQPAALDQPRVNVHLRRNSKGPPLAGGDKDAQTINIPRSSTPAPAASCSAKRPSNALGIKRATHGDKAVVFHDVGVGGSEAFDVSEPLFVFLAAFGGTASRATPTDTRCTSAPSADRSASRRRLMDMLTGGLDVVGMPAMKGRVVVLDPRPVDTFGDTMHARAPRRARTSGASRRPTATSVLSYASFARFTRTEPRRREGPDAGATIRSSAPAPAGGADRATQRPASRRHAQRQASQPAVPGCSTPARPPR